MAKLGMVLVLSTLSAFFGIRIGLLGPVQPATSDGSLDRWETFPRLSPEKSGWLVRLVRGSHFSINPCISAADELMERWEYFRKNLETFRIHRLDLVGGWPTPLKNDGLSNSWDDDIPNIWKVIKFHVPVTTNQWCSSRSSHLDRQSPLWCSQVAPRICCSSCQQASICGRQRFHISCHADSPTGSQPRHRPKCL